MELTTMEEEYNEIQCGVDKEKLKQSLETQLSELEMLQSMFYNPGEIRVDDQTIVSHVNNYVNNKTDIVPTCLDFTVNLQIDNFQYEVCVSLPHNYPDVVPDIFVRSSKQSRDQQRKLNTDLSEYVQSLERGDICIFSAITWLQDKAPLYVVDTLPKNNNNNTVKKTEHNRHNEYARYWIYSHHIYSKTKRREILNLADEYALTGFCLPGKPGVICIEGGAEDCNSWWMFIKSMCWKRIVVKLIESETCDDVQMFRKFTEFKELAFQTDGNRGTHMSLGDLVKYLEVHKCADRFKEIFGLDSKNT